MLGCVHTRMQVEEVSANNSYGSQITNYYAYISSDSIYSYYMNNIKTCDYFMLKLCRRLNNNYFEQCIFLPGALCMFVYVFGRTIYAIFDW